MLVDRVGMDINMVEVGGLDKNGVDMVWEDVDRKDVGMNREDVGMNREDVGMNWEDVDVNRAEVDEVDMVRVNKEQEISWCLLR